jgi:hypothetical protein
MKLATGNLKLFPWDVIAKNIIWQEKSGLMNKGEYVLIGAIPVPLDF